MQIWDTAGDYKLRDLISLYYRNSHAAVLVFDITQDETKENLQEWLAELEDRCDLEEVNIKVAANKFDIFEGGCLDYYIQQFLVISRFLVIIRWTQKVISERG